MHEAMRHKMSWEKFYIYDMGMGCGLMAFDEKRHGEYLLGTIRAYFKHRLYFMDHTSLRIEIGNKAVEEFKKGNKSFKF
jgi:hypothetical protein